MDHSGELLDERFTVRERDGSQRPPRHRGPAMPVHHATPSDARQHAEKLSETGARIARVAHELNAPLSLICGSLDNLGQYFAVLIQYVQLTAGHRERDQELARLHTDLAYVVENGPALIGICRAGAERLNHVTEQLKGYTRRTPESEPRDSVDLRAVVREAVSLAAQGRRTVPKVHEDLCALPRVAGSAASLSQAFVNVVGNAFDAVASARDPQVWISAEVEGVGSAAAAPCRWIQVRIRDNGPGIAEENRIRVFEAFFTTKSRGSGLGLGLAIAKEIIESEAGTITLAPASGPGAEFVIRLLAHEVARNA